MGKERYGIAGVVIGVRRLVCARIGRRRGGRLRAGLFGLRVLRRHVSGRLGRRRSLRGAQARRGKAQD